MKNNNPENIYASLLHSAGFQQKDLKQLFENTNHLPSGIFEMLQKGIDKNIAFIPENRRRKILQNIKSQSFDERKIYLESKNITLITLNDANFPKKLKHIYQIPYLLYAIGSIQNDMIHLGIVGSRKSTDYGNKILQKIFGELPYKNISIISGGAYGIDGLSHSLALEKWLHTVAVFGCGIDIMYPKTHKTLFEKIVQNGGALISIFPIQSPPDAFHFPIRNEIVAGLSDMLLIPEAGLKSGTLITARLALELGKDIFAIPGDIFRSTSQGCNHLINAWEAKCTLSAHDIFTDFSEITNQPIEQTQILTPENIIKNKQFHSPNGQMIFEHIFNGKNTLESILQVTHLPIEEVSIELTMLELDGHISTEHPGFYQVNF